MSAPLNLAAPAMPTLEGVFNFRDFGGAMGADGRRVATGRLFRSGHLGEATDRDVAAVASLGLGLVVDLRRANERDRLPSRLPQPFKARVIEHQGPRQEAAPPHLSFLGAPGLTEEGVIRRMRRIYEVYPFDPTYVAVFRNYFTALAQAEAPVLVHCYAGKDRTGMLAALTLHALGVGADAIAEDFLATNAHNRLDERVPKMMVEFERDNGKPVQEALLRRMLEVRPEYITATFDILRETHGSADGYLEAVLGVGPQARQALRARYLTA